MTEYGQAEWAFASPARVPIVCGEEDLNDHHPLRKDVAFQTAPDRVEELARPSTLCG